MKYTQKYMIGVIWFASFVHIRGKDSFISHLNAIYQNQHGKKSYETLQECLWSYYQNPINLNNTSREELKTLSVLTSIQIDHFFKHLAKNGKLYSRYELQAIPEWDLQTISYILPFIYVAESYYSGFQTSWQRILESKSNYCLVRYGNMWPSNDLKKQKKDNQPLGGNDQYMLQLLLKSPQDLHIGIRARKNKREAFIWDHSTYRYGFNLWSLYLLLQNKQWLKNLILGDYQVGYGQGLVINSGFIPYKGADIKQIMRYNNVGIKPYKAITRIGLRGIAATYCWGQWELTTYYASNNHDATVIQGEDHFFYINAIKRTGIYDTNKTLFTKGTVNEQVIGATGVYKSKTKKSEVGINILYNHYDLPIMPKTNLYSAYLFQGKDNFNMSIFYRYLWYNMTLFGEGACSNNHTKSGAALLGCVANLFYKVDLSLLLRYYGKSFYSPYGNAFKDNTQNNANEKGMYLGICYIPIHRLQIMTYYDLFRILRPKFNLDQPATGSIFLIQILYHISDPTLLTLQYKKNNKIKNIPYIKKQDINTIKPIGYVEKNCLKLKLQQQINQKFTSSGEGHYTIYTLQHQPRQGYAFVYNIGYQITQLTIHGHFVYFCSEYYETRLFVYEKSMLYSRITFVPYQGQGIKYCILICYKPMPRLRIEVKYDITYHYNLCNNNKSLEQMPTKNIHHDLNMQILFNF